ncbi:MAG TPA: hypothetical protein VGK73_37885 [Polyangiaceae bacterium]
MTRPNPASQTLALTLALAAAVGVVASACSGEDGATPVCPAVPLYDIGAAGERNEAEEARLAAVDAGCMTDIDRTDIGATE